jgi:hypothetical protein
MPIEALDISRRRYLMQRVMRKVQGWQSIWMTSEFDNPCIAKGRYLAAKEFYEWLAGGGEIAEAKEWLVARGKHYHKECESPDALLFSGQLSDAIAKGYETEESLKGYRHALIPGFTISEKEREAMNGLSIQYRASETELWHLERFLKDPFVMGQIDQPPPPPPRAVVDDVEYEDENEEPD